MRSKKTWLRWLSLAVLLVLVVVGVGAGWVTWLLRASLPQLDGRAPLSGLEADVRVDRDELGVPAIYARSRADGMRALGYLHGQDRFFQMDLVRRQAAGELAELFGEPVVATDEAWRVHRFRHLARRVVESADAEQRALLDAYVEGVNAGLAALGARPPEYVLLRLEPAAWQTEDSILALFYMFHYLQSQGARERQLGLMHETLPAPLFDFLAAGGTSWDAPLVGEAWADPEPPDEAAYDLRAASAAKAEAAVEEAAAAPGSNNWAVSAARSTTGSALLAGDMHLAISVPNTWYRASLVLGAESLRGAAAEARRVTGVTLPGFGSIIAGSNGHLAWAFTNSTGDWSDVILLEPDPADATRYLTPEGSEPFEVHEEEIRVKGQDSVTTTVRWTRWGPVIGRDHAGRELALRWVAHDVEAVDFDLLGMETATNVEEAFEVAHGCGMPAQNLVVATDEGTIAWTIIGTMPRRVGFDGALPTSWADGSRRWDGWLDKSEYPRIVEPEEGLLWTANNRLVEGEELALIGDGGYALGARARQIRDGLRARDRVSPEDMLAIQLDDRALFLTRWRELLLATLEGEAAEGPRGELRSLADGWSGRAAAADAGYRLVRRFRSRVAERSLAPLLASVTAADESFRFSSRQVEGALWSLVETRPRHMLDAEYESWDALLLAAADDVIDEFGADGARLADATWGKRNTARIRHPLSLALPWLSETIDMPREPLDGDRDMPRVAAPAFGASQRFVVSPGREEDGVFHMPGGQSGHPLSPYYSAGHDAWVHGEPTPFLPGPSVHTLVLESLE